MTIKINRRDDTFAKLVAEAKEAPGFSYAKSRNRDYKGFNDDFQAEKLLKDSEIQQAVTMHRKHIIERDVASRLEVAVTLTEILRAPRAAEVKEQIKALNAMRLEPEVYARKVAEIDMRGIKKVKETKYGVQYEDYDKRAIGVEILRIVGVDITKPMTAKEQAMYRKTMGEIFSGNDDAFAQDEQKIEGLNGKN